MSLVMIYGPAGSGKTTLAVEEFVKACKENKNPFFIAPSGPDALHFQRLILKKLDPLCGGSVTTFQGLCRKLLNTAQPGVEVMQPGERLVLLRAIAGAAVGLTVLAESSGTDGFALALERLFSEFTGLGLGPAEMAKWLGAWSGKDAWRRQLTKDLFYLHQEYRSVLDHLGVYDHETAQEQALSLIKAQKVSLPDAFIVDGFWDFTPIQQRLIKAISAGSQVTVTLPAMEGRRAYLAPLRQLKYFSPAVHKPLAPGMSSNVAPALRHIQANLFQTKTKLADAGSAGDSIVILRGAGTRGQGELIASEILRLWRNGHPLDRIAVICRNIDRNLFDIAQAMEKFAVPYEMPGPVPLKRTPVGRAALAALDFVIGDQYQAAILSFLRSGFPQWPAATVDRFERHIKICGIKDRGGLLASWKKLSGGAPLALNDLITASREPAALADELERILAGMVSLLALEPGAAADLSDDLLALKEVESQCLKSLNWLRAVEEVSPSPAKSATAGWAEAARFLRRSISTATIRRPTGMTRGCVRLLDPHRALNQRFDTVFICGLLEKQFPSLGLKDPFFTDSERCRLASLSGLELDNRDNRLDEERFLFHRSISRAQNKLYLCYPYCDKEGRPTVRSLFVEDVLDLFEPDAFDRNAESRILQKKLSDVAFPVSQAPTEDEALISLALCHSERHGRPHADQPGFDPRFDKSPGNPRHHGLILAAAEAAGLQHRMRSCLAAATDAGPLIKDPEILRELGAQTEFVITELQKYLRCPFRYFIESIMSPMEMDQPSHGVRRGRAAHNILCRFGEIVRRLNIPLADVTNDQAYHLKQQLQALIEEEFGSGKPDLKNLILKNELICHLSRYLDRERASGRRFVIYDVEASFGPGAARGCGGKHNAGEMLNLEGIKLKGRIDRIDWAGDSDEAIVIDYKTSKSATSHRQFDEMNEIQIPLYLDALRIFGLKPVAGEYYAVLGDERAGLYLEEFSAALGKESGQVHKNDFIAPDAFAQKMDRARQLAREAAAGIRAGRFPANPVANLCRNCGLGVICRRAKDRPPAPITSTASQTINSSNR